MKKLLCMLSIFSIWSALLLIPVNSFGYTMRYGSLEHIRALGNGRIFGHAFTPSWHAYISDLANPTTDNQGYGVTKILPQVVGGARGLSNINGMYSHNAWGIGFPYLQFFRLLYMPYY